MLPRLYLFSPLNGLLFGGIAKQSRREIKIAMYLGMYVCMNEWCAIVAICSNCFVP